MKKKFLRYGILSGLLSLVAVIAAVFLVNSDAIAQVTTDRLDHFQCYRTKGEFKRVPVGLKDQFVKERAWVVRAVRLCNPVHKIHNNTDSPIIDPNNHLVFYKILPEKAPVTRHVVVSNQFGDDQRLEVKQALFLATPAQKRPHDRPQNLDHFKCYRANGQTIGQHVALRDQFLFKPQVGIRDPLLLCNPVEKRHVDAITPVLHPQAHLVCYRIQSGPFTVDAHIATQFGAEDISVNPADMVCVPSKKTLVGIPIPITPVPAS